MKSRIIFKAVYKVASQYGDKWARKAGDKAVTQLSELARKKGLTDRNMDLNTLTSELKEMYRQGRFNKQEWEEVKAKLQHAWKNRKNNEK